VAPRWPSHARHVAVEFVHPVIVGKRALPGVSVDAAAAAPTVRQLARPGDVLLAVSTAGDRVVADLLTRADAWGLTSVWLGAGPRTAPGAAAPRADHVVWLEDADAAVAARSGDLVLLYHLLWELTHVVFEHPGLLTHDAALDGDANATLGTGTGTDTAAAGCSDEVCITCSDEGRVAEVRALLGEGRVEVLAGGHAEQIDGRLVEDLRPGDLVLVHAGVAVTSLMGLDA
jgi:hydrogenase maturation factor